jgi:hypothetical protein
VDPSLGELAAADGLRPFVDALKIEEEGAIEQDGKYYFRDETNPDLYYYYDPVTKETKQTTLIDETELESDEEQEVDLENILNGREEELYSGLLVYYY